MTPGIKGFKGYNIDKQGKVYSFWDRHHNIKKECHLLKVDSKRKYSSITLFKDGRRYKKSLHRLLADTFIPNTKNYPYVLHRDGNKYNNKLSNLYWGNQSMNQKDAVLHGTASGLTPRPKKLNFKQVRVIKYILDIPNHIPQVKIAGIFNVHQSLINRIANKKTWKTISINVN